MSDQYVYLTKENVAQEHVCCAIADKKHQSGVEAKKKWMCDRFIEGHTFYKLNQNGKVFIEYAPLETAWVPIVGNGFLYIYCLWVSGKFKGNGHAKKLLEECINSAKKNGNSGLCVLTSKKKIPFLSEKGFFLKNGFEVCDAVGEYELLFLSLNGSKPEFSDSARLQKIPSKDLTIYYGLQCPYIPNCVDQISLYCKNNNIPLQLVVVDSLKKAKTLPCIFNNWAVFYNGEFKTVHLLNEGFLKKLLESAA